MPSAQAKQFERAYRQAGQVLEADSRCLRWEIAQGVEESGPFVVRIEWTSIEVHEQGFRASPPLAEFSAAVRPFFSAIEEMKRYELRTTGAVQCLGRNVGRGRRTARPAGRNYDDGA